MSRIWIPLPDRDFDVTEVAVPWRQLTRAGDAYRFGRALVARLAQGAVAAA